MRKMIEPEIRQALSLWKWATICTVSPGRMPYAIEATYFMADDSQMNFMINPRGTTVRNIQKNPHVLVKVTLADPSLSRWAGVSVFGIARMERSPAKIRRGWALLGQVMNADYREAAEKFVRTPEKSPLFIVDIREMTGRCSAGPGSGIDFQWFDQRRQV
ncbi:pyridoxamine 5'-phosphate oxidase family protein [Desulfosalsimonas propionicica]